MNKMKEQPTSEQQCENSLKAIADALYVIGGKWKLQIIVSLQDGNKRFNDLQRSVKGISARVLSNELKNLELNGFIKRIVYTEPTVVIEYVLTEYSDTLRDVLRSLGEWGVIHKKKIKTEFDGL